MELYNDLVAQITNYYDKLVILIPKLAVAIILCFILSFTLRFLRKKFSKYLVKKADDKLVVDFTDSVFRIINVLIILQLFLYTVGLGNVANSILGAAGVSAFVIGFAMKDIGENFISGLIMAFDRPFRTGDTIKTKDVEGTIVEMSLRDTQIKTYDGKDVFVPNGQIIKEPLYNYTIDGYLRASFIISIAYGADIERARAIIMEAVNSVPGVIRHDKVARSHVKSLTNFLVNIEVFFWFETDRKDISKVELLSQAQSKCFDALTKEGMMNSHEVIEFKSQKIIDE